MNIIEILITALTTSLLTYSLFLSIIKLFTKTIRIMHQTNLMLARELAIKNGDTDFAEEMKEKIIQYEKYAD